MAHRWQTHCPTCGDVVHHNHNCRGATPPCPRPAEFWTWVEQARAEAAHQAQTTHPLTLDLEVDP